jgi:hypothetical protein
VIVLTSVDVFTKQAVQESWRLREKDNSGLDRTRGGNKRMRGVKHKRHIGKETIDGPDSDCANMEQP